MYRSLWVTGGFRGPVCYLREVRILCHAYDGKFDFTGTVDLSVGHLNQLRPPHAKFSWRSNSFDNWKWLSKEC
jgi:hypothetical protein